MSVSAALLTAVALGLIGLITTAVFGLRVAGSADIWRHISSGIFSTMVILLAHSMMMFYLIGKGKAVKDAMIEGALTGDQYRRIAAARKPVLDRDPRHGRDDGDRDPRREWTPAFCRRSSTR